MANLSQIFKNGQVLQAKAGPLAIAQNDIVALGGVPPARLYPVKNSNYGAVAAAGDNAVALTTVSPFGQSIDQRKRGIVDPATNDLYIADTYLTYQKGCQIWKYDSAGNLRRSLILDDSTAGTSNVVMTMFLSNGNILVCWTNISPPYTLYFAIVDKWFNVIVAKTAIANASTNPPPNADCIALSGGGFAVVWALAGGQSYFTIRSNSGAVVYPPTVIADSAVNSSGNVIGPVFRMRQLSDGNIFVGIVDKNQGSSQVRYCIFTPTGGVVKAYTILTDHGSGYSYPEIDVLPGAVCMAVPDNKAYVFNNAGTLQGTPQAISQGYAACRICNDGTYFWVFSTSSWVQGLSIRRLATNGVTVQNTLTTLTGLVTGDPFLEQGQFVVFVEGTACVISVNANGIPTLLSSSPFPSTGQVIGGLGDFTAVGLQTGKFQVTKYLSASIIGISQTNVAANNAGALVTVNVGPGAYITNEIKGSPGKAYDHSAAPIVGNKGAIYPNSVVLKGI